MEAPASVTEILNALADESSASEGCRMITRLCASDEGQVAAGDLDDDGVADLIVPDYARNKVTWLKLNLNK